MNNFVPKLNKINKPFKEQISVVQITAFLDYLNFKIHFFSKEYHGFCVIQQLIIINTYISWFRINFHNVSDS